VRQTLIYLFVLALLGAPGLAQPHLVKDINPITNNGSSQPSQFVRFGKNVLFNATTILEGTELWVSDGTAAGTFLLVDSCPEECSGNPTVLAVTPRGAFFTTTDSQHKTYLWVTQGTPASTILLTDQVNVWSPVWVASQGLLYFNGGDRDHGSEPWRTDGTPAGTFRVADIWPGPNDGLRGSLVAFKDRVFFEADDGVSGTALWTSDGTAAGTRLVKDISPSASHAVGALRYLQAATNFLFFQAQGSAGWELWRSDGTAKGTQMIADLVPGPGPIIPNLFNAKVVGSRYYMEAAFDSKGTELWVSDGTKAGTKRLTDFASEQPFSPPPFVPPLRSLSTATAIGDKLYFIASETSLGRQIWRTDGTAKGTHPLTSFCPGTCVGVLTLWPAQQNRIYFTGSDGTRGVELWTSDGTNTHIVRDICRGACSAWPSNPTLLGDQLFFTATDAANGAQIWRTNGTPAGTTRVSGLPKGNFGGSYFGDFQGTATSDKLLFAADDGIHGRELWISDGTPPGTRLLADLDSADHGGSAPSTFMTLGGTLLFFANDGEHGDELWKSDGTAAGTTLVHEFVPGPESLARFNTYGASVEAGGMLYAILEFGNSRRALWRSDGTDAGTVRLTPEDVEVAQGGAFGGGPVVAGGKIFFVATEYPYGRELWVTDGTPAGTRMVADLYPGTIGSEPLALTSFQGKLFFSALSPNPLIHSPYAHVPWSSDGTEAGTAPVSEAAENPVALTLHQGFLYFFGQDPAHGLELWRSDGTEAGTALALDVIPGSSSLDVHSMVSMGSRLLFWAGTGHSQSGLWVTDGTAAATKRISAAHDSFALAGLQTLNGIVYFPGEDGTTAALWRTDGTEAGTFPLRDKNGATVHIPPAMTVFDGRLYFITPDIGATLWQSDGTAEGTFPLRELEPGQHTSLALGVAGSRLFFRAFDPATGSELWAIDKR